VSTNGTATGPYDMATLRGMVASGALTRASHVWTQGAAGWTRAGETPALAGLFADVPPPPPPAD
jgi:hypothetical protein